MDDNNSDLAQQQWERERDRIFGPKGSPNGGGRVGGDRSNGLPGGWFWNIVGSLIVLALAFVANNLYQVNLTLAADAVSKQEMLRQIAESKAEAARNAAFDERQEEHINAIDRRVIRVEEATGVQLRGGRRGQ